MLVLKQTTKEQKELTLSITVLMIKQTDIIIGQLYKVWNEVELYDASEEIRNKHINREEGVTLVNKYDGEFPIKYFKEFLKYLDLEKDEFFDIADRF